MARYTKHEILSIVREEDVKLVRLQFTDILGNSEEHHHHCRTIRESSKTKFCLMVLRSKDSSAFKSPICTCTPIQILFVSCHGTAMVLRSRELYVMFTPQTVNHLQAAHDTY